MSAVMWHPVSAGPECIAGWPQSPQEEVPVSSSYLNQGLLIAENAL